MRRSNCATIAVILALVLLPGTSSAQQGDPLAVARNRLVDEELVPAGIHNERVIDAMRRTPRHEFVPQKERRLAYYDMALPIGHEQTISPPFVVASMTERLDPQPSDKVLEIGTGSGYQAAVLSPLVAEVYSIEIVEPLGKRAAATLKRFGYENVITKVGDGYQGWAEHAPFDKIIVTCSPEEVPQPLVDQLREGGRMIVPLGERYQQMLYLFKKVDGKLEKEALEATFFVPMTGRAEELRQVLPDDTTPALVNGDFEEFDAVTKLPRGWYYVRQAEANRSAAPQGKQHIRFRNETPGRDALARQAIGVDGRKVRALSIAFRVRTNNVVAGPDVKELAALSVTFFGEDRQPVREEVFGPWSGSSSWTRHSESIVVPAKARGAIIGIGLFGATGAAEFDDIVVTGAKR